MFHIDPAIEAQFRLNPIVDSRTSVIRSLIERAGSLQSSEQLITEVRT